MFHTHTKHQSSLKNLQIVFLKVNLKHRCMDYVVKLIIINLWLTFIFNSKCLTVFIVFDDITERYLLFWLYLGSK